MKKWMQNHWKLSIIIFVVAAVVLLFIGGIAERNANKSQQDVDNNTVTPTVTGNNQSNTSDSLLMQMQPDLVKSYGSLPDGYIWNLNGSLLSLGDKNMAAEDVVYAYFNGLKTLDFSMVQKYSRESKVVDTYSGYFNSTNKNTDYMDAFNRNMYREAMLSIKVLGIENCSVFAENKQVYTVRISMLDLTQKDFWKNDKIEIYEALRIYNDEDSTRAEMYLYDYILAYYKSGNAATRELTIDLTLEKYPDLDTGWLVSIDTDIDDACRYSDGKPVVNYINEMYLREGKEYLESSYTEGVIDVTEEEPSGVVEEP